MQINIIHSYRDVVTICDTELIGKYFEEQNYQLDVKESFYKGEEKTPEESLEIIQKMKAEDATFNIVGEKAIELALQVRLISKEAIKEIQGIPFSMVFL